MGDAVKLVDRFISQYVREIDFYEQAARLAASKLETELQSEGIRCIVTSRAKSVLRLEEKVRQRNSKTPYRSLDAIYGDIVDLAGVRVALYFPAERDQVGKVIERLFSEYDSRREFPNASPPLKSKRFSGYSAVHYRVRLRASAPNDPEARYLSANIEVQIASVLMHAWSEVEHDLVYKPYEGKLSDEEYDLLDQLNGLVLAGEIALERLQKAGEARVAPTGRHFANHYELAAHLLSQATMEDRPVTTAGLGRVDLLFGLLARLDLETPGCLEPYLESLHADVERRPLSEQVIDALLAEDPSRYEIYQSVRQDQDASRRGSHFEDSSIYKEVGYFLTQWVRFERLMRELVPGQDAHRPVVWNRRAMERLSFLEPDMIIDLDHLRQIRNEVVHGIKVYSPGYLQGASEHLEALIARIEAHGAGGAAVVHAPA
ncbi:GTP pyrophosphokinase family protein [Kribbella sp. NPDC004875]|uniref:GTP pyrophosphokinase n=1 Tax=Kribbella sp. NPDC004875 TaxID=3364107 RepID=UPI0036B77724